MVYSLTYGYDRNNDSTLGNRYTRRWVSRVEDCYERFEEDSSLSSATTAETTVKNLQPFLLFNGRTHNNAIILLEYGILVT